MSSSSHLGLGRLPPTGRWRRPTSPHKLDAIRLASSMFPCCYRLLGSAWPLSFNLPPIEEKVVNQLLVDAPGRPSDGTGMFLHAETWITTPQLDLGLMGGRHEGTMRASTVFHVILS